MSNYLIIFALFIAAADWFAIAKKWKKLDYIAKPGVIVILIAWLVINFGYQGPTIYFLIGLLFSLAGDIFLMLPDEKFLAGLISFLIAHLAYIRGFTISGLDFSATLFLVIVLVGLIGSLILRKLLTGLKVHHKENLRYPVILYTSVIYIMLITALYTVIVPNPVWDFYPAILVSFGATLFFISDTTLAWNKFVNQITYGRLLTRITYHLAQITITLGAGLNFLS